MATNCQNVKLCSKQYMLCVRAVQVCPENNGAAYTVSLLFVEQSPLFTKTFIFRAWSCKKKLYLYLIPWGYKKWFKYNWKSPVSRCEIVIRIVLDHDQKYIRNSSCAFLLFLSPFSATDQSFNSVCVVLFPRRSTILVKLSTGDSEALTFEPGDHLGVCPCNDDTMVDGILQRTEPLDVDWDTPVKIERFELEDTGSKKRIRIWLIDYIGWSIDWYFVTLEAEQGYIRKQVMIVLPQGIPYTILTTPWRHTHKFPISLRDWFYDHIQSGQSPNAIEYHNLLGGCDTQSHLDFDPDAFERRSSSHQSISHETACTMNVF